MYTNLKQTGVDIAKSTLLNLYRISFTEFMSVKISQNLNLM